MVLKHAFDVDVVTNPMLNELIVFNVFLENFQLMEPDVNLVLLVLFHLDTDNVVVLNVESGLKQTQHSLDVLFVNLDFFLMEMVSANYVQTAQFPILTDLVHVMTALVEQKLVLIERSANTANPVNFHTREVNVNSVHQELLQEQRVNVVVSLVMEVVKLIQQELSVNFVNLVHTLMEKVSAKLAQAANMQVILEQRHAAIAQPVTNLIDYLMLLIVKNVLLEHIPKMDYGVKTVLLVVFLSLKEQLNVLLVLVVQNQISREIYVLSALLVSSQLLTLTAKNAH